ncbi:SDR family oxidoreductase [Microbacterium invictum]|uniref:SDR family oxidoreductase n=1 Tax=Microbacterium invictum TaxID=515415 RepID=A0ABZ0VEG1_9MICO|nr:SDR family oxidoreductase [Microbacterium invictum]WQB71222.1 SDR family oxidoreductase [Microbacterium invictum]
MLVAVVGGTGTVGAHAVRALREKGHDAVALSRSNGVDVATGDGLDDALRGAAAVIDTTNLSALSARASVAFFEAGARHLLAAAERAGTSHLVTLSIVGIDRMPYDYYAGKVAQERLVTAGSVPWSIVRSTQFHEFAAQIYRQAAFGPIHLAPRARLQPVAATEVGAYLADVAVGAPRGRAQEIAGPLEEALDRMVADYAGTRGERVWTPSVSLPTKQMKALREGRGLPVGEPRRGDQTYAEWLTSLRE